SQKTISQGNGAAYHNFASTASLSSAYVLLISNQPARHYDYLIYRLKDRQLNLMICTELTEAKHLIVKYQPIAILLDCGDGSTDEHSGLAIEQLLADHSHLRFIALITAQQDVPSHIQDMLRNGWLYDFHTIPIDNQRLAHTLG